MKGPTISKWVSMAAVLTAVVLLIVILIKVDKRKCGCNSEGYIPQYCSAGFAMLPDGSCIASQPYYGKKKVNRFGIVENTGEDISDDVREGYCVNISGGFKDGCECDTGCMIGI